MARQSDLIVKRNADLRRDYEKLRKRHNAEYTLQRLSERYYLSKRRIEDILFAGR